MIAKRPWLLGTIGVLLAVGLPACRESSTAASSPGERSVDTEALREVGEMYRLVLLDKKTAPKGFNDFQGMQQVTPAGYRRLKDGQIIAVWGVQLTDLAEEGSRDSADEVLAYAKDVPEKGGAVLMKNRTVKEITPEQFKAALKAGGG